MLILPRTVYFLGKLDTERIKRMQFPLGLSWAKTVHKSQGAREPAGIMATLDRHARETPGLAYVALSRCKLLRDMHLRAFDEGCLIAPSGVERALALLKLQQARCAGAKDKMWWCFGSQR